MDEEDYDSDIAAAMGFSSFGGTKKRKHDQTNSPKAAKVDASGANSTQLGVRTKKTTSEVVKDVHNGDSLTENTSASRSGVPPKSAQKIPAATGLADFLARAQTLPGNPPNSQQTDPVPSQFDASALEMVSFGGPAISKPELNALQFGVRNEHGDTAYFLPNFIGDPWERMKGGK
jgi:hypothetical protein